MQSTTYNPILPEESFESGFFAKVPIPAAQEAILLTGPDGALLINDYLPQKQWRRKNFNKLIRIDLRPYQVHRSFSCYCTNQVNQFQIEATIYCVVENALDVYHASLTDIGAMVERYYQSMFSTVASHFNIEDSIQLQDTLLRNHQAQMQTINGVRFGNISSLSVTVDEKFRTHLQNMAESSQRTEEIRQKTLREAMLANQLQELGIDEDKSVFMEVAAGRMTTAEAHRQIRRISAEKFDEQVRRFRMISDIMAPLIEQGNLPEEDLKTVYQSLFSDGGQKPLIGSPSSTPSSQQNQSGTETPFRLDEQDDSE